MIPSFNLRKAENICLLIILVVAAALRFYHYGSFSYSNDEMSAINRLHYNTFGELVQKGFYVDGHPGGVQTFLWQWVKLFGDTEWAVRLPFVILGILSVWMSFKVAKFMFGISSGLFAAAAITFLQFPILYSQIARPYGPGMLFGLMLVYFWLHIFFTQKGVLNTQKPKLIYLVGFTLSAALCMYTHYFSFLFALIVGFSGFVVAKRNNVFHYVLAALLAALLFVPHIYITLNHLTFKGLGLWLGVPGKGWIFEHLYFIFDQSIFTLLLFLITLPGLLYFYQENKGSRRFRLFLAAWFIAPVIVGYIYSLRVNPVLQHPVLIFSFPYFIILIFSFAGNELNKVKLWLLAFFLVSGVLGTTLFNKYYQQQHFGEFRDIARLTAHWQSQYGDSSITKVISVNTPYYIDYYLSRYHAVAKFELYDIRSAEELQALSDIVKKSSSPYFLYALTKPSPPGGEDIIRSSFPYVVEMKTYGTFSSVVLFGRKQGETYQQANHLTEIKTMKAMLNADSVFITDSGKPATAHKLDSMAEYSPAMELNLDDFRQKEHLQISAETDLFAPENTGEAALVISIETLDGKSIQWKGAASKYVEIQGKWCHLINTLSIDEVIPKGAKMKVYFWNKDKKKVFLRNLGCSIYHY